MLFLLLGSLSLRVVLISDAAKSRLIGEPSMGCNTLSLWGDALSDIYSKGLAVQEFRRDADYVLYYCREARSDQPMKLKVN